MEIIATVPPPHKKELVERIAGHPYVDALRFNTGARTVTLPLDTLRWLQELSHGKPIWIDLKGRQLRITRWADLEFDPIQLNHKIKVDLPATIILRNGTDEGISLPIRRVEGRNVFVDSGGRFVVGEGQSVNIHGENLRVEGYLTRLDEAYINAANLLGMKNFMLSFVEKKTDMQRIGVLAPDANLVLKIESEKGMELLGDLPAEYLQNRNMHLMVARDDLMTNLSNPCDIIDVTQRILNLDSRAIVASRILTSLVKSTRPVLGDLADLKILRESRCYRIMLCDDLCASEGFEDAMDILKGA